MNGIYGYRRMTMNMERKFDQTFNEKRIYRLMKIAGLQAVIRRKKKSYIPSQPQHVAENKLNRDFTAEAPNEKWLTDVTEFKYGMSQKAYLSAILDLYDNSIVAFKIGTSNNNQLVFETINEAIEKNKDSTALLHSDRGSQYTSHGFKRIIDDQGMEQSMSRVGKCIDNGPMEGFFGIIKSEEYYLPNRKYRTFEELEKAIIDYIYFYNHERYQKGLTSLSPIEYRTKAS